MISRTSFAIATVLAFSGLPEARESPRPNIIHIMVDDLGWRDLSIYGSETFHTPNIDALAARGIRYSNAYSASPLCSPTRASTLMGQTVGRIRFTRAHGHVGQAVLDPWEADSGFPGYPMTTPGSRTRLPLNTPINVHAPFQGRPEDIEAYSAAAESARYQRLPTMASMVKTLDDNVGRVMSALERLNLIDNTIVIFTSDNGGNMYNRPEGENPTSNYPLRAGKGNNYEGGIRVSLIVSWPGQIAFNTVTDAVYISDACISYL